jgi:hypothetical protein
MALATKPRFSSGTAQLCRHRCGGIASTGCRQAVNETARWRRSPRFARHWRSCVATRGARRESPAKRGQQVVTEPRFRPALPGLCHHEGYLASTEKELVSVPNAKREKLQNPNVTFFMRGRGALRGESGCHGVHRLPFPPTVPHRHPAPPAAAGRVPRSPPARRRSAPSPVGPSPPAPCRPRAARSRRPPARDAPAAGRGPCGPVRGPERGPIPGAGARPAGRSPRADPRPVSA